MKLTKNFYLYEFIESRFYDDENQRKVWQSYVENENELLPNIQKLANQLQTLRNYFNANLANDDFYYIIEISIAYRPKWWELKQGRSGDSRHVLAEAGDIKVYRVNKITRIKTQVKPKNVATIIEHLISNGDMLQGGLGVYKTFCHYDYRGYKARW